MHSKENAMKQFACGDRVPGCEAFIRSLEVAA